jgi:hypothetical protein
MTLCSENLTGVNQIMHIPSWALVQMNYICHMYYFYIKYFKLWSFMITLCFVY